MIQLIKQKRLLLNNLKEMYITISQYACLEMSFIKLCVLGQNVKLMLHNKQQNRWRLQKFDEQNSLGSTAILILEKQMSFNSDFKQTMQHYRLSKCWSNIF